MRRRYALLLTLVAVLFALPASSAQISEFHYDVTGGFFGGTGPAAGPITGGSLWITPAAGSVSTPDTFQGNATLTLTGPGGAFGWVFEMSFYAAAGTLNGTPAGLSSSIAVSGAGTILTAPAITAFSQTALFAFPSTLVAFLGLTPGDPAYPLLAGANGFVGGLTEASGDAAYQFAHKFTMGNEVRTIVPEPSTAGLFGLGILGLAILGSAGGARRRER